MLCGNRQAYRVRRRTCAVMRNALPTTVWRHTHRSLTTHPATHLLRARRGVPLFMWQGGRSTTHTQPPSQHLPRHPLLFFHLNSGSIPLHTLRATKQTLPRCRIPCPVRIETWKRNNRARCTGGPEERQVPFRLHSHLRLTSPAVLLRCPLLFCHHSGGGNPRLTCVVGRSPVRPPRHPLLSREAPVLPRTCDSPRWYHSRGGNSVDGRSCHFFFVPSPLFLFSAYYSAVYPPLLTVKEVITTT